MSLLLLLRNHIPVIEPGTGAWSLQPTTLAASGWMAPDGTASPSLFPPALAATGEVVFTATGALTIPSIISLSGAGSQTPDGDGELSLFVPSSSGSGWAVTQGNRSSSRINFPPWMR